MRFRIAFAVALGLVGLSVPASASAASTSGGWSYVVRSANGTVAWQYSGPGGSGADSVTFNGGPRRTTGMLHGRATYVDQNTRGCGPIRQTRIQNFGRPSFAVEGRYVVVTWSLPLPNQSFCDGAVASSIAQSLGRVVSQKIPLSRFTCPSVSLRLSGATSLSEGGTTGTLGYQTTVVLTRFIRISV